MRLCACNWCVHTWVRCEKQAGAWVVRCGMQGTLSPLHLIKAFGGWSKESVGRDLFSNIPEALRSIPGPDKSDMVHACCPSTEEVEAGRSGVQGQPRPCCEFEVGLG